MLLTFGPNFEIFNFLQTIFSVVKVNDVMNNDIMNNDVMNNDIC